MTRDTAPAEYAAVTSPGTVRIERLLRGPIERIWSYLTDPEKRQRWMVAGTIELGAGGKVEQVFCNSDFAPGETPPPKYAAFAGEVRSVGRVLECRPPRFLAYTWNEGTDDPSEVRFELAERGDKVLLVVMHRQLAQRDLMLSVAAGWHTHLDVLVALLEHRAPGAFWAKQMRLEAEYEARIPPG